MNKLRIKSGPPTSRNCIHKPPAIGGKALDKQTLTHCPEVPHQDEPTAAHPINAHKQMAGHQHPGHIGQYKG
jgi:hypothetical protein